MLIHDQFTFFGINFKSVKLMYDFITEKLVTAKMFERCFNSRYEKREIISKISFFLKKNRMKLKLSGFNLSIHHLQGNFGWKIKDCELKVDFWILWTSTKALISFWPPGTSFIFKYSRFDQMFSLPFNNCENKHEIIQQLSMEQDYINVFIE